MRSLRTYSFYLFAEKRATGHISPKYCAVLELWARGLTSPGCCSVAVPVDKLLWQQASPVEDGKVAELVRRRRGHLLSLNSYLSSMGSRQEDRQS